MGEITELLSRANNGDAAAREVPLPLAYKRLLEMAQRQLATESARRSLNTSSLAHELSLDLLRCEQPPGTDHARFFGYSATAMRQILVDEARRHIAQKRGGGGVRIDLESASLLPDAEAHDVVAIDQAPATAVQFHASASLKH